MRVVAALRALGLGLLIWVWAAPAPLHADAIPPMPEPTCEEGFVPTMTHSGGACVRPSCAPGRPCPAGLVCPPRRCVATVTDPNCWDEAGGAKGPPNPCESSEDRGPCDADGTCPEGSGCLASSCVLPQELAELEGEQRGGAPASRAGGGCCGSRGARPSGAAGAALMMSVVLSLLLRARGARGWD